MVLRDKLKKKAYRALWPLFPATRDVKLAQYKTKLDTFWRWVAGPELDMQSSTPRSSVGATAIDRRPPMSSLNVE